MLVVQVVRGMFLCFSYRASSIFSFRVIDVIVRDINRGDVIRKIHAKGATLFFLFLYLHTGRGVYFSSYKKNLHVWNIGITIFLMSMAIAFLGYVLPWGQMSYWGATVITNLFGVIPLIGKLVVEWLWGGFSVNSATLTRFFGLHVILPLVLVAMMVLHILLLHNTGSSNPIGLNNSYLPFHPYWTIKDAYGVLAVILFGLFMILLFPFTFMDAENFIEANFMVTPVHIQPEWYFLPAYAVLRSVPKKLGGVVGLLMVFLVFYIKPFFFSKKMFSNLFKKLCFWIFVSVQFGLLWIGSCVVEGLYIIFGQIFRVVYFVIALFV